MSEALFLSNFKPNKDTGFKGKVGLYGRYIGECAICGRLANYNQPYIDLEGTLVCNHCAWDVRGPLLIGISQSLSKKLTYKFDFNLQLMKNGIHIGYYEMHKGDPSVYFANSIAFPLLEEEREMRDIDLLDHLFENYKSKGILRCTDCKKDLKLKEIAGRPLFAGINCDICWDAHQNHLNHQRHTGQVCSMCGDAWDACCC